MIALLASKKPTSVSHHPLRYGLPGEAKYWMSELSTAPYQGMLSVNQLPLSKYVYRADTPSAMKHDLTAEHV